MRTGCMLYPAMYQFHSLRVKIHAILTFSFGLLLAYLGLYYQLFSERQHNFGDIVFTIYLWVLN